MTRQQKKLLEKIRGAYYARTHFYGKNLKDIQRRQRAFVHGLIVAYRIIIQKRGIK